MTVTQETADTVSGTVSKDSIPQKSKLSTLYIKIADIPNSVLFETKA